MSTEFKREERYIVFKLADVEKDFFPSEISQLLRLSETQQNMRKQGGKPPLEVLCIEKDWPEYEDFKSKILHRAAKEEIVDRISPILRDNLAFPDDVIRQVEKIIDSALPKEPSDGRTN